MKLNSFSLAALVLILLFGGISFTAAMNWWQTETTKVPAAYTEGEAAGQYNPADIRGSYTFGEVSDLFGVPLSDLKVAFRIPANQDPAAFQMKSLEELSAELPVEIGTASVRMFVAFYKGLPFDLAASEETYLFPEAAAVLKAQNKMLPEQVAYLDSHLAPENTDTLTTTETPQPPAQESASTPTEHVAPEKTVNGQTTFQNLLDWGLTKETIESILGDSLPSPQTIVKDYTAAKSLEFSSLKTQLQAEVDKLK